MTMKDNYHISADNDKHLRSLLKSNLSPGEYLKLILHETQPVKHYVSKTVQTMAFQVSNLYPYRVKWQKLEFFGFWFLALLHIYTLLGHPELFSDASFLNYKVQKFSVRCRALTYLVDIANAIKTLNRVPLWLICHHVGVCCLAELVTTDVMVSSVSPFQWISINLAFQAASNTWTKRISLILYWGNVLLGLLCILYLSPTIPQICAETDGARIAMYVSGALVPVGVFLLVWETYGAAATTFYLTKTKTKLN